MAGRVKTLAFFQTQVRGVKFYSLSECGTTRGVLVKFVRKPNNCRDKNCVEARVAGVGSEQCAKLGHVAAEAAECSLLCCLVPSRFPGEYLCCVKLDSLYM